MLVTMTDMCRKYWSLEVPALEAPGRRHLQEISPPYIRMRNPVDVWPSAIVHEIEFAYREGMEAVDLDYLVQCLMAMGRIGMAHEEIQAIDVNPLIVRGNIPVAVDALVILNTSRRF